MEDGRAGFTTCVFNIKLTAIATKSCNEKKISKYNFKVSCVGVCTLLIAQV